MREITLGQRIKTIRTQRGLSQQAFAAHIGTSSGYISEIEQSKKVPGGDVLLSLWRAFGVDLNWLLTGESAGPAVIATEIPADEARLLSAYRDAGRWREDVLELAELKAAEERLRARMAAKGRDSPDMQREAEGTDKAVGKRAQGGGR